MARSIYLTSPEGDSGKSVVALGLVDLLSRTVQRVGVFRPVARSTKTPDYVLELLLAHDGVDLMYDECVGVTYEEVLADPEQALAKIVQRYHEVARRCDAVVVVGTDYTDVAGPTELAYNGRIAANLGAPVVLVVNGSGRTPGAIHQVVDIVVAAMGDEHAQVVGVTVNRCGPAAVDAVKAEVEQGTGLPTFALPESPLLTAPTVRQLMEAVGGELMAGDEELLSREVLDVLVGAMSVEHLLDRIADGAVVITPGDRSDVLLGLLIAHQADGFPSLAGIILNGGFEPSPVVQRLIDGLGTKLPIIETALGSFRSASAAASTRGHLSADSQLKVDTALALFEAHVDGPALLRALDVARPEVVTPLMFEYELLDRARADKKHIVLPEGSDDRILRAASTLLRRGVAHLTILGDQAQIRGRATELGLDLTDADVIDPHDPEILERFATEYAKIRAHKGMTVERAREIVPSVSYFGTLMVHLGLADGMVSGAAHTTARACAWSSACSTRSAPTWRARTSSPSGTASCTAGPTSTARRWSTTTSSPASTRCRRSLPCTTRRTSRASRSRASCCRTCRTSSCSTPRSSTRCPTPPRRTRSTRASRRPTACAATASTARRTSTCPARSRASSGVASRTSTRSSCTSATARRRRRSAAAWRSRRRWA
ncbi:hypothetical protein CBZ_20600 [Cellulomonas biazotea]|uniref:Phosphate acetyltransferase n=1 Tax=Cellulomonas biazotea TaxID=1709 RepID=A0A402DSA9_9CELL|nr:hypothetical protein CBZ_20600 [Cellulomonas biazotea]